YGSWMHPSCVPSVNPLFLDPGDLDAGQRLAVPLALVVTGLVLVLVDLDLRPLGVLDEFTARRDAGVVGDHSAFVDEHHRRQRKRVAGLILKLLDCEDVALGDLVLLSASLDDCVHVDAGLLGSSPVRGIGSPQGNGVCQTIAVSSTSAASPRQA